MGNLGFWEILLILLVVAVLFGGKKLPELGRGIGEAIKNFKKSMTEDEKKESEKDKLKDNEKDN